MLRVPTLFVIAYGGGLIAQVTSGGSSENIALYTIVGGALVTAFTAVWTQLWKMHSSIINGKDTQIAELIAEVKELRQAKYDRWGVTEKSHEDKDA